MHLPVTAPRTLRQEANPDYLLRLRDPDRNTQAAFTFHTCIMPQMSSR